MGSFGTYCGTLTALYEAQINSEQLKNFADDAAFLTYMEDVLIPAAEAFIDTYCHYSFGTPSLGTLNLDGNGKDWLPLPPHFNPAIGFSTATVNGSDVSSYIKTYPRYVKLTSGVFNKGEQNVTLVGSYGHLDGHGNPVIPGDITMVCARLVGNVVADMNRRHLLPDVFMALFGDRRQAQGSAFHALFASPKIFSPYLKETLEPYRVRWVDVG